MKDLNKKLAIIQTKLKAKKSSYNSFGKYHFRKAEDILEAIKPFLLEQNVSVRVHEELVMGDHNPPIIQSTAIISDGENSINATAIVGVDLEQKGMQTAQQFGAASSYGKKYALGNLFLIDDTADADSTTGQSKAVQLVNKVKPVITKEQFNQAIKYVENGGSIRSIENKYHMSIDQLKLLKSKKQNG